MSSKQVSPAGGRSASCKLGGLIGCALLAMAAACSSNPAASIKPSPTVIPVTIPVTASATPQVQRGTPSPPPPAANTVVSRPGIPGLIELTGSGALPASVSIQQGRNVTWSNADAVAHRVVSDEPSLYDTGELQPGERVSLAAGGVGAHPWHDLRDPRLRGLITVLP